MSEIQTHAHAREISLGIVVTKADGTVEDYGEVAYWHKNPLRRLLRPLTRRVSWRRS